MGKVAEARSAPCSSKDCQKDIVMRPGHTVDDFDIFSEEKERSFDSSDEALAVGCHASTGTKLGVGKVLLDDVDSKR